MLLVSNVCICMVKDTLEHIRWMRTYGHSQGIKLYRKRLECTASELEGTVSFGLYQLNINYRYLLGGVLLIQYNMISFQLTQKVDFV